MFALALPVFNPYDRFVLTLDETDDCIVDIQTFKPAWTIGRKVWRTITSIAHQLRPFLKKKNIIWPVDVAKENHKKTVEN